MARSLNRYTWWKPAELLQQQATIQDRKTVWAALPNDETRIVAGAQGWMDYLIGSRKLQPVAEAPPLAATDAETMWDTFKQLERGRQALGVVVGREFTSFSKARILEQLTDHDVIEGLVTIAQCISDQCRAEGLSK